MAQLPRDLAVFTLEQVIRGEEKVKQVVHDREGNWQFLPPGVPSFENLMVITIEQMVDHAPEILELLDLPRGWKARRVDGTWKRSPLQS